MQTTGDGTICHPKIAGSGMVFSGCPGSDRQSATFPLPCVTPGERWLCAFRAAPGKHSNAGQRVLVTWSDDHGRSWHDPIEPFEPIEVEGKPGRMRFAGLTALDHRRVLAAICWVDHSQPILPYFNEQTEGLLDTRIFLSESTDAGESWGPLRPVDTSPFDVPVPLTGPILRLENGEWACQFELNKMYEAPEPWRHASVMMFSGDAGRMWPRHSIVAQDPENRVFYWDQRPAVLPDGRIFVVFWTFDRQAAVYRNIHARESWDCGRTWSPLWDTGVAGQPGPVFPLADGVLGMPYVDRTAAPAIKVCLSADGGRSWIRDGELVVYASPGPSQTEAKTTMQDAWAEMYKFSVGLPNLAPMANCGALLVYYAGDVTDVTAIRWAAIGRDFTGP